MDNIDELLQQADNRFSIAERYEEWKTTDEKQANENLEKLVKSYEKDEFFEEYFIDRVKDSFMSDKELLDAANEYSEICKSEMVSGKSVCYAKHYAELKLCREFVDDYCRLTAEVWDYAYKQGVKEVHFAYAFASACAEAYVNERITDLTHLKDMYTADWQQDYLISLHERMIKELEAEEDNAQLSNIPSTRRKTHTDEILDMMFPERIDDGFSFPED